MSYGLFYLPSSLPAARGEGAMRFRTVIDQAAYGEEIGFESVWLAEHHFHPFAGIFSAPPVIGAAIAERTRRMRIGTAVLLLPYHHPLRVAENYATLDCLSGGRVEFGVGHGFVRMGGADVRYPARRIARPLQRESRHRAEGVA